MQINVKRLALGIESTQISQHHQNFRPKEWPPSSDFPISIDLNGQVISRYGDPKWNLSLWANRPVTLNFGDGPQRKGVKSISSENADLLRQIAAWWLWGPRSVRSAITLEKQFTLLRPLFIICSDEKIIASRISRHQNVLKKYLETIPSCQSSFTIRLLHMLRTHRADLGFELLDRDDLRELAARHQRHHKKQTPYIPPRIWKYQVLRLREFLDDFKAHQKRIEACYHHCLKVYSDLYGSLDKACNLNRPYRRSSFTLPPPLSSARDKESYQGSFYETAKRFGIDGLLERWATKPGVDIQDVRVSTFSSYFTMATRVGIAYVINFSLMRISEAWLLRSDCLETESDETFGDFYIVRGRTTKTISDDDARWITSPSIKVAVDVLIFVGQPRLITARAGRSVHLSERDIANPYLASNATEPWVLARNAEHVGRSIFPSFSSVIEAHPKLFEREQLTITEEDLNVARLVTPTLSDKKYQIGKVWPLCWHQLRRTGLVNMQASGLVSDSSLQYQLKHSSRVMSLYYGQGYSRLSLNSSVQTEYIRTIYEVIGLELSQLLSDRFRSPYGDKHKNNLLHLVNQTDSQNLSTAAREGKVFWRTTLLGGCTRRGPCEYGGIDNIIRCGGGDGEAPCSEALYDERRLPAIIELSATIRERLSSSTIDSAYRDSLKAQLRALENVKSAINRK